MKKLVLLLIGVILLQIPLFANQDITVYQTMSYQEFLTHIKSAEVIGDKDGVIIVEIDGVIYCVIVD